MIGVTREIRFTRDVADRVVFIAGDTRLAAAAPRRATLSLARHRRFGRFHRATIEPWATTRGRCCSDQQAREDHEEHAFYRGRGDRHRGVGGIRADIGR